jgi:hypothetical protein
MIKTPVVPIPGVPPAFREQHHLTFRNSRIIYYGPHECERCGVMICRMGHEFGANAFTYPEGPIYPNTEWHPHVCVHKHLLAERERTGVNFMLVGPGLKMRPLGWRDRLMAWALR